MLKEDTYLQALEVAKQLADRGIYLTARPDSPLGALVEASASCFGPEQSTSAVVRAANIPASERDTFQEAAQRAFDVACVTGNSADTVDTQHSRTVIRLSDELTPFLQSHLSHARTVVSPLMNDYLEKLQAYKNLNDPADPVLDFTIDARDVPELLRDASFMADGLERIMLTEASDKYMEFYLKPIEDLSVLHGFLDMGSDRINGLVQQWLAAKPAEFIKLVFDVNFVRRDYVNEANQRVADYHKLQYWALRNAYDTLDIALACYLIAGKLAETPIETQGSVSLEMYKRELNLFKETAGIILMRTLREIERQVANDVLVSEVSTAKKTVVLHKPVYKAFTAEGGTAEAIYGLLVNGEPQFNRKVILGNRAKLEGSWNTYLRTARAEKHREYMQAFCNYAKGVAIAGLSELGESELAYATNATTHKDAVAKRIEAEFERLGPKWCDDLVYLALRVIAGCRFYYTSAYELIGEMVETAKVKEDVDSGEAALFSTLRYLSSYFADQIAVGK